MDGQFYNNVAKQIRLIKWKLWSSLNLSIIRCALNVQYSGMEEST